MRKLIIGIIVFLVAVLLVGRAWDYEQGRLADVQARVTQLEVHDCGLRQFEDYSIAFERDDETRFRCAAIMRGELVCSRRISGGDPYYVLCRKP